MFKNNIKQFGSIILNKHEVTQSVFSDIGKYVLQDDILIETMTPKECFMFACQMCGMSNRLSLIQVENMLVKLRLKSCQNTKIGGVVLKGLSGGERKRTSIGFDLI